MTPLRFLAVLTRHPVAVMGLPLGLALVVGVLSLMSDRTYTSAASFAPQAGGQTGQLSGLAAQFGVNVRSGGESQSPRFYADLLRSRVILSEAVESTYDTTESAVGEPVSLVRFFEIEADDPAVREYEGIRALRDAISSSTDPETGLVQYSVSLSNPALAQEVADRLLTLLGRYDRERRQTQAREEREFVEGRLEELGAELRSAEARLEDFVRQNRSFEGSPSLSNEYRRLLADAELKRGLMTSLSQSYEEARIEEVRNTPVLSVVQPPTYPVRADGRGTVVRVLLTLFVGALLGIMTAFSLEYLSVAREEERGAYEEIRSFPRRIRSLVR